MTDIDLACLALGGLVVICLLPRARISLWAMPPGDGEEQRP